jgi:hypothetical protein
MRPKGSKNKPKIIIEGQLPEAEIIQIAERARDYKGNVKEYFNDIANGRDETPYPSNWESLSKVDKLSWLTSNRRK